ncbi:MAG: kinase [Deltaproteobacteria bacterium]|jgi:serine/threonine protein kinase|nr:kinase [Deltaproteobacteria bacterium]
MSIVRLTANDGSIVEFDDCGGSPPKQGGVKDVYFTTDNKHAVAFFRDKLDAVALDRIDRLVNKYRKTIFDQPEGDFWKDIFCWPEKIVTNNGKTGIVIPFYDKKFFFKETGKDEDFLGGAEKEGKWFTSAKNFNLFVPPDERGNLLSYLSICLNLSRGVKKLHMCGLAHSDLSYKNCLVDPLTGSACIIDIDGLVVPGLFPPDVIGTRDFIAPEVVATMFLSKEFQKLPCRETDQHALSVLIYEYFFHRHPLDGDKIHDPDPDKQEHLEMGEKALFIENPHDASNRRSVKPDDQDFLPWIDTEKLPYTIAGPYLKELFDKAFITGLHNPAERPTADDWDVALVKTRDLLVPCSNKKCSMKWFIFGNAPKPRCPYCGSPYKESLPMLDFYSKSFNDRYLRETHRLMVYNNQHLYQWHVDKSVFPNEKLDERDKKSCGYFTQRKNKWYFVNMSLPALAIVEDDKITPVSLNDQVELKEALVLRLSDADTGRLARVMFSNTG